MSKLTIFKTLFSAFITELYSWYFFKNLLGFYVQKLHKKQPAQEAGLEAWGIASPARGEGGREKIEEGIIFLQKERYYKYYLQSRIKIYFFITILLQAGVGEFELTESVGKLQLTDGVSGFGLAEFQLTESQLLNACN